MRQAVKPPLTGVAAGRKGRGNRSPPGRELPPTRFLAAATATLLTALTLTVASGPAQAASGAGPSTQSLCAAPAPGTFGCFAKRRTDIPVLRALTATPDGYGPADLRSAYDLPADGGAGA